MHFLEECRKSEEEGKDGQARAPVKAKIKAAAASPNPNKDDMTRQLKYQQHQIDALVGQVKDLSSDVQTCLIMHQVNMNQNQTMVQKVTLTVLYP